MDIRSLTQAEAEQRAALLEVERYDIDVDLTDLPTGPEVRCVSTITFTCREPGAATFVDCAADVVVARPLNGVPLPPAESGRIALDGPRGREHAARRDRCRPTRPTARACTRRSTRPTARSTCGCRSSPTRRGTSGPASTSPTSRRRTRFTVTAPAAWTVRQQHRRPGGRGRSTGTARRWTFPDTPPLSTYNPVVHRRALPRDPPRGRRATTSASSPGGRWPPSSSATPTSSSRSPSRGSRSSARSSRCRSRSASTTRCSCPSSAARWRTTAASRGPTRSSAASRPTPAERRAAAPRCCCTRWRTCGSATSSRCAGGTTSGSTRRSPSSPATGRRCGATALHRRVGRATSPSGKLRGLPRRPGPDLAPDPAADPRRRAGGVDLRRDHLPQGRLGAAPADDLRRRGAVRGRDGGVLRRARLGQHHAAGPDRRAGRAPAAATSTPGATAGWRPPAPTGSRSTRDGDGVRARRHAARRAATRARRSSPSAPTARTATGCERIALASVEVHGTAHRGRPARGRRPLPRQRRRPHLRHRPARRRAPGRAVRAAPAAADRDLPRRSRSPRCGTCSSSGEADRDRGRATASPACCARETSDAVIEPYLQMARRRRRAVVARRPSAPSCQRPVADDLPRSWPTDPARRQVALRGARPDRRRPRRGRRGCRSEPATTSTCSGGCWSARPSWAATTDAEVDGRCVDAGPDPEAWVRALGVRAATPDADAKGGRAAGPGRRPQRCRSVLGRRRRHRRSGGPVRTSCWRRTPTATSSCCPAWTAGGMIPAMVYTPAGCSRCSASTRTSSPGPSEAGRGRAPVVRKTLASAPTRCAGCCGRGPGPCRGSSVASDADSPAGWLRGGSSADHGGPEERQTGETSTPAASRGAAGRRGGCRVQ